MPGKYADDRALIQAVLGGLLDDLARFPKRADWRHKAALCHMMLRDRPAARAQLEQALEANPRYFDALRALAFLELADGRYEPGEAAVKRIAAACPDDPRGPLVAGLFYASAQRWATAEEALEAAGRREPTRALAVYALAHVKDRLAKDGGAQTRADASLVFQAAGPAGRDLQILGNPGRAVVFREAARRLAREGDPDAARRFTDLAFSLDLDEALHTLSLGDVALDAQDLEGAVIHYRRATELDPDLIAARTALAAALGLQGDLTGAIAAMDEAVKRRPAYPDLHYKLGALYLDGDDTSHATEELEAAVSRNGRYGAAHFALGQARLRAGDARGAAEAFTRAAAAGLRSEELSAALGFARLRLDDLLPAEDAFREAIQLDESLPAPYLGLALAAEKRGDLDAARAYLARYDEREHELSASEEAVGLRKRLAK